MIARLALYTVFLLLQAAAARAANDAFTVITPPNKASVDGSCVALVVAVGSDGFDSLRVAVDGRTMREVARMPGQKVLCIDGIPLSVGINRVQVTARRGKEVVGEEKLTLMMRSDLSSIWNRPPHGFRSYAFHGGEPERRCLPCHGLDFAAAGDPASPQQSPCFVCHKQLLRAARNLHGPAAVWSCLMCHTSGGEAARPTLQADNSQCIDCHGDAMNGWQAKQRVHGPLAVGSCSACHSPHGSDQPLFLKVPQMELCTSCHEGVISRHHAITGISRQGRTLYLAATSLRPGKPLFCIGCHEPHATDAPYLLRTYRETPIQSEYCQSCHTNI